MRDDRTPPAFVIAVATMLVAGIGITLLVTYAATQELRGAPDSSWWSSFLLAGRMLLSTGTAIAITTLMLVGMAELVRRSGPGLDGLVLRAGLVALVVMLLLTLASTYMNYWWWPRAQSSFDTIAQREQDRDVLSTFWRWRARLAFVAALVTSASLVFAGRRDKLVLVVAAPLLILTAFQFPTEWLDQVLSFEQPDKGEIWLQSTIDIWIRVGFCGALMATVSAIAAALPAAPVDMRRAGQGVERVGSGLLARVILALVTIFTVIMTVGTQQPGLARVAGVIFPTCLLIASLAIVTGMLQAGGLTSPGAPRLRLYAGAALTMTAMVIDALKAISVYLVLRRGGDLQGHVEERLKVLVGALPYFGAALSLVGLWCMLSAAAVLRRMAPEARVDERGINAAAASVTIFTVAAVALFQWGASGVRSPATFVIISIVVGFANIVAQLAVARVCHRVGEAMREVSALPTAVATVK